MCGHFEDGPGLVQCLGGRNGDFGRVTGVKGVIDLCLDQNVLVDSHCGAEVDLILVVPWSSAFFFIIKKTPAKVHQTAIKGSLPRLPCVSRTSSQSHPGWQVLQI
jgi:hypothetical protein